MAEKQRRRPRRRLASAEPDADAHRALMKYRRAASRSRRGIRAALADLSEEMALNTYETQAVHERLDKIEPKLTTLENERQRRIGVVRFFNDWRVWIVTLSGGAAWAWQHFFSGGTPPGK